MPPERRWSRNNTKSKSNRFRSLASDLANQTTKLSNRSTIRWSKTRKKSHCFRCLLLRNLARRMSLQNRMFWKKSLTTVPRPILWTSRVSLPVSLDGVSHAEHLPISTVSTPGILSALSNANRDTSSSWKMPRSHMKSKSCLQVLPEVAINRTPSMNHTPEMHSWSSTSCANSFRAKISMAS